MNYPVHRTPEQGHTKACLAKAMIVAIENLRDDETTDVEFRVMVQANTALEWADMYLEQGMTVCLCPDPTPDLTDNEEALAELGLIVDDLDSTDPVRAEEGSDSMELWIARWLPSDPSWQPLYGEDLSTLRGIEYWTPDLGNVRLVVR